MRVSKRTLIIVLAVIILAIIVIMRVADRLKISRAKGGSEERALVIKTEMVHLGTVLDQVPISGPIRPANEVDIYPKIAGRIITLNHNVGDQVKIGEVLAVIEHREIMLKEKSARAALAGARTNEDAAKIDFDRARELFDDNAISKVELEGFKLKYDVARADRLSREAEAEIVSQQLRDSRVTSLINGVITKRSVDIGVSVSLQAPIFTVEDISKLKLVTTVDAQTLRRLKKGSVATLTIDNPSLTITGKVVTLSPSLDHHSRRASVEIEIDDQTNTLVPNMFVDGSLEIGKLEDVLVVPNKTIIMVNDKQGVYRIVDHKAFLVNPKLGLTDGVNTAVLDGLKLMDLVAISGLDALHDQSKVSIEEAVK